MESMASMEERVGFLSLELSKKNPNAKWRGAPFDDQEQAANHVLQVHSVIVGKGAVKGEDNLVQISVPQANGENVDTPLAYVSKGGTNQVAVNIRFPSGIQFSLAEGTGPVHILATHIITPIIEDDFEEEEDDDEVNYGSGDIDGDSLPEGITTEMLRTKRKQNTENGSLEKKRKINQETSDSEDDELNEEPAGDV